MRVLFVSIGIWKWEGFILVGGTPADFSRFTEQHAETKPDVDENAIGHAFVQYGKPWVLWMQALDWPTLAHEALHVTSGILEARGLRHTEASEEAYTYTMEAIMRAVETAPKRAWKRARQ